MKNAANKTNGESKMNNLIDITSMSDAALDVYLRVKGGEETVCVEHLTVTERRMVAVAMGWDTRSPLMQHWMHGSI